MIIEIPLLPEVITPEVTQMYYSFKNPTTRDPDNKFSLYNPQLVDVPVLPSPSLFIEAHLSCGYRVTYFDDNYDLRISTASYQLAKLYLTYLKEGKDFIIDEVRQEYPEAFL